MHVEHQGRELREIEQLLAQMEAAQVDLLIALLAPVEA